MHPIITAYLRYKGCADLQISYHSMYHAIWITECKKHKAWLDELMAECVR